MNTDIQKLSKVIADLFHPLVEVSFFKADEQQPVEMINPFSSLRSDQQLEPTLEPHTIILNDGRHLKTAYYQFTDTKTKKPLILRIRYDISVFNHLQQQLSAIIGTDNIPSTCSWVENINNAIQQYTTDNKQTIASMNRSNKRQLVYFLKQKGLLEYKDATNFLAKKLQTSRATIYNYLNWAERVRKVDIHQVNSFTDKPFGGNPAGVILEAESLSEDTMRDIAKELNFSESAFLLPSQKADFRLRYFTKDRSEVNFCGHSTVGTLYMIAKNNLFDGKKKLTIETNSGIIESIINKHDADEISIEFQTPKVQLAKTKFTHEEIASALGISKKLIDENQPILFEKTNSNLFVSIQSLKNLEQVQCDFRKLKAFMSANNIIAICLLTPNTFDEKNDIHMRCFSPAVGVNEDPFTGSVLGGLAAYVHQNKILPEKKHHFIVEQGHFLKRPGSVALSFRIKNGQYKVTAHAKAMHFYSTEIQLLPIHQLEETKL